VRTPLGGLELKWVAGGLQRSEWAPDTAAEWRSLSAAGVALEALTLPVHPGVRRVAALLLIVLGILAAVRPCGRGGGGGRSSGRCGAGSRCPRPC